MKVSALHEGRIASLVMLPLHEAAISDNDGDGNNGCDASTVMPCQLLYRRSGNFHVIKLSRVKFLCKNIFVVAWDYP